MPRYVARSMLATILLAAALLLAGCGSECSGSTTGCGHATVSCDYSVEATATVPPIGKRTWTVTGCLDTTCNSVQLDAKLMGEAIWRTLDAEIVQADGGTWQLRATLSSAKSVSGQTWSLLVTDDQGTVITQGSGTVHYPTGQACPRQEVTIP